MPKSTRRHARAEGTSAHNLIIRRPTSGPAREAAPDLSRAARRRLAMLDWHRTHGASVSLTARHYGVGRPTVYRWLRRFDRDRLETLEDHACVPHRRRRPTWTSRELLAVKAVRERFRSPASPREPPPRGASRPDPPPRCRSAGTTPGRSSRAGPGPPRSGARRAQRR